MKWVINKYYYIINFRNFLKPRIYPVYFTSRAAAKRAISQNVPSLTQRSFYDIIKGNKLKDFKASYVLRLGKLGKFTKYIYTKDLSISKKAYRTKIRRRLRRMGMLSNVKSKYGVGDTGIVKYTPNSQWVADSPNTWATTFQLERKPRHIYYKVLRKSLSKKKGNLFKLKVLRINMKSGDMVVSKLNIKRKDIITPYLTTEIEKMYGQNFMDRARGAIKGKGTGKI